MLGNEGRCCRRVAATAGSRVVPEFTVTMPRPTGFTHVKQQRTRCEDTEQSEQPARSGAATDGSTAPTEQQQLNIVPVAALPSRYSHAELAVLLWSTDYVGLLLHELIQYPDVAVRSLTCERAP